MTGTGGIVTSKNDIQCMWEVNGNSKVLILLPHKSALFFMKRILKCNNGIPVFTYSTL